ncbi:MAG: CUAEP/CCAEP-tail radical SAM (seleno)protein [Terriglobales bacterium]
MRALLIGTYEMGRQPFGLASPAAWLRRAGWEVLCIDTSRQEMDDAAVGAADLIGLYLPMHTATRLALTLLPRLRALAPKARICAFGLYAPMNAALLRAAGADTILGPEFEADLVAGVPGSGTGIPRLQFTVPDRRGLPPLSAYAHLHLPSGEHRITGYTEASRGCKHQCRHCPIVPIYGGQFRIVAPDVVLADIRQQVEAGAEHITFGDPDFFNGPTHAMRIVEALHRDFPALSFDVTIKVEHLLHHSALLPRLRAAGCALITTAVESFDDAVLAKLDKGHTAADFFRALDLTRRESLPLNPTFVSFTPWTTVTSFRAMFEALVEHELVHQIASVQFGIRLLIPEGSRILELPDAPQWLGAFDAEALSYRWRAPEPEAGELCTRVQALVAQAAKARSTREETLAAVAGLTGGVRLPAPAAPRATIPYLDEPWFC